MTIQNNVFAIKVKNFKCFGENEQGFESLARINLIIGRNNSGKSSLLELIEFITKGSDKIPANLYHAGNRPEIFARTVLNEDHIRTAFLPSTSGGSIPWGTHFDFGRHLINYNFCWRLNSQDSNTKGVEITSNDGANNKYLDQFNQFSDRTKFLNALANNAFNPLAGKTFTRINPDRNIGPEVESSSLKIDGNGIGVTNVLQSFINKTSLSSDLVEKTLLHELNQIFGEDSYFTRMLCQRLDDNRWEIFLEEESKGRISLSQSGTGLKTIILVLVYIHLIPIIEGKKLSDFVFGFEELENNLHPALFRRLLTYIRHHAIEKKFYLFLTTHSNVAIDMFSKDEHAQILHVTHNRKCATVNTVNTYTQTKRLLDDLDVRASDLLQSNGVIWVEGPSDRIYLNRWIELWSSGELKEGIHYQCIYYGGKLLSHLCCDEPDEVESSVAVLRVNKNAAILIDSDKKSNSKNINATKQRIVSEMEKMGGTVWITKGKEIENYLPFEAIRNVFKLTSSTHSEIAQYEDFVDYLNTNFGDSGKLYESKKACYSDIITQHLTRDNSSKLFDLNAKMTELCIQIRKWNNMPYAQVPLTPQTSPS